MILNRTRPKGKRVKKGHMADQRPAWKELLIEHQALSGAKWNVFEAFLHGRGTFSIISASYDALVSLNHNRIWEIGQPIFYAFSVRHQGGASLKIDLR